MPKKIDLTHKIFQDLFVIRETTKEEKILNLEHGGFVNVLAGML
jgi:hypothetical protein